MVSISLCDITYVSNELLLSNCFQTSRGKRNFKLLERDAKYEFTIRQCVNMAESYIYRTESEFYTRKEMRR